MSFQLDVHSDVGTVPVGTVPAGTVPAGPVAVGTDPVGPVAETRRDSQRGRARGVRRTHALRCIRAAAAVAVGLALVGSSTVASAAGSGPDRKVAQMRAATDRFHSVKAAEAAGYVPFQDVNGVSCIADADMGAMGVHYVNPKLIANPSIDAGRPEALVYAPAPDGRLRLAALEFLVTKQAWDAQHSAAPRLFATQHFDETAAPNRFGLPDFYSQHVWVWKHNPAGLLSMWNPTVHCPMS